MRWDYLTQGWGNPEGRRALPQQRPILHVFPMPYIPFVCAALTLVGHASAAAPTQSELPPIRVGMSTALTGPAAALGRGVKSGAEAYFLRLNSAGGVQGRQLELIVLDDGYEPARTGPNMRSLVEEHEVFAVIGNVGTPTAAVAVPIAGELKVPLFGAFTGAGLLRKSPPDRWVVNYRASYAQETAAMVDGLVGELGLKPSQIAFFTQNDAYGMAGYNGGIKALEAMGFAAATSLPHGRYTRNTIQVESGLAEIMDPRNDVKAVIMVGAYKPCAQFIRLARQHRLDAVFINVSFVGSAALAKDLGPVGEGVVVTQVVPHFESDFAGVQDYRTLMPKTEQGFVSLEGYMIARSFVTALQGVKGDITRDSFIDTLEAGLPIDLGLSDPAILSPQDHQLSDTVWPTVIQADGSYRAIENWADLRPYLEAL